MKTEIDRVFRAFTIGQRVRIVDSDDKHALVQSILYNADGAQYQISYWHDSIRRIEWVFPSEIERLEK